MAPLIKRITEFGSKKDSYGKASKRAKAIFIMEILVGTILVALLVLLISLFT